MNTSPVSSSLQKIVLRLLGRSDSRKSVPGMMDLGLSLIDQAGKLMFSRGTGCRKCNNTGYHGQVAIAEIYVFDEHAQRIIARNTDPGELIDHAVRHGFKEMLYDGLLKVACGITTLSEVERVLGLGETPIAGSFIENL